MRAAAALLPLVLVVACDTGPAESVYDPDRQPLPDPVITSVAPDGAALAGVDEVTLTGQNFSSTPSKNLVYFGVDRAQVLSASPTQLVVLPKPVPAESVEIRVTVIGEEVGAEHFSNAVSYRMDPAYTLFGSIGRVEEPVAIATDDSGLLYMSLVSGGSSAGFKTISTEGVRADYAATAFQWRALAPGPDGLLYAVRGIRAAFRFAQDGAQETFLALTPTNLRLVALTFDPDGNLWTGGDATPEIIRIAPDKTVARFAFDGKITALEVFGDALYAVAEATEGYGVWRFPMDANRDLGAGQMVFDITAELGAGVASEAIAFAADGTMFLGTDRTNPVEVVYNNGSHETLYPGVLVPPDGVPASAVLDLAWGEDPYLYMLRARPAGDAGAGAEVLVRIDTRTNGAR
jgi:hypothetical protein